MARINVEDSLFTDARYEILAEKYGRYAATGMIVHAWKMAQKYFLSEQKLIPVELWELSKLQPIEECGLAEKRPDGIYVKGSHDQFEWLKNKQLAGQKSAMIRAQRKSTHPQQDSTGVEHTGNRNEPLTLTLTPTLTLNSNVSQKRAKARSGTTKSDENIGSEVWDAYATAMLEVYGYKPPRNAKTNSQCKKFIEYVGKDLAIKIASIYPYTKDQFHAKSFHSLDVMLCDHAKLCLAYQQKFGNTESG